MLAASSLLAKPFAQQAAFNRCNISSRRRPLCRVAVVPAAAGDVQLPKAVTVPKAKPVKPVPKFGFVDNAERLNSRAAMIGFFGILAVEAIFNKPLLSMLGFTLGQGLPFEF
ncbi:hypothetical protein N2152v2_003565 [Parachlorella kessleri]